MTLYPTDIITCRNCGADLNSLGLCADYGTYHPQAAADPFAETAASHDARAAARTERRAHDADEVAT